VPKLVSIGLSGCHLAAKNPNFAFFWSSAFSGVANWQQSQKVEHVYTDKQTNRQTKNSTFLAAPAADEIRASPNLAG